MSNLQIKVNIKTLLFTTMAIVATIGVVIFFAASSKKTGFTSTTKKVESQDQANEKDDGFLGEKGVEVKAVDGKIYIDESEVDDSSMHTFNYYSEKEGKAIYFFIVKASDGTYRAAANACETCFGSKKGFKQIGDLIRCENCRVTYPKDKIALEKGGCNPGPIDKDVAVENGKLVIDVTYLEKVAYLF